MNTVSVKTRTNIREYLSTVILKKIHLFFSSHEIPLGDMPPNIQVQGERRPVVERYYAGINWNDPRDLAKMLMAFEDILEDIQHEIRSRAPFASEYEIELLNQHLERIKRGLDRDGFPYDGNKIAFSPPPAAQLIHDASDVLDPDQFGEYVDRINSSIDIDPALAIGSTKELLEAVLKTVLVNTDGSGFEKNDDMPVLLRKAQKVLKLMPSEVDNEVRGAEVIRVLLSNLGSVVIKLDELRNLYGTGHGKEKPRKGMEPRHAKLAVGAGVTLSIFLLDTFKKKIS